MLELSPFKGHHPLRVVQGCVGTTWASLPALPQTGSSASWAWIHPWKANVHFSLRKGKWEFPVPFQICCCCLGAPGRGWTETLFLCSGL